MSRTLGSLTLGLPLCWDGTGVGDVLKRQRLASISFRLGWRPGTQGLSFDDTPGGPNLSVFLLLLAWIPRRQGIKIYRDGKCGSVGSAPCRPHFPSAGAHCSWVDGEKERDGRSCQPEQLAQLQCHMQLPEDGPSPW